MKPAISCIAWSPDDDELAYSYLAQAGLKYVEVVPGRVDIASEQTVNQSSSQYKERVGKKGIQIVAMQALLFGTSNLSIFESDSSRIEMLDHLKKVFLAGGLLGVERYVFGSPKNRIKGELSEESAMTIAAEFFNLAAIEAEKHKGCLCIEANPKEYGGDFILSTEDAAELVSRVGHDSFGLHLDTGGMILADENMKENIKQYSSMIKHFHISVPNLEPIYEFSEISKIEDAVISLKEAEYQGYISLEMKGLPEGRSEEDRLQHVKSGIESLLDIF